MVYGVLAFPVVALFIIIVFSFWDLIQRQLNTSPCCNALTLTQHVSGTVVNLNNTHYTRKAKRHHKSGKFFGYPKCDIRNIIDLWNPKHVVCLTYKHNCTATFDIRKVLFEILSNVWINLSYIRKAYRIYYDASPNSMQTNWIIQNRIFTIWKWFDNIFKLQTGMTV